MKISVVFIALIALINNVGVAADNAYFKFRDEVRDAKIDTTSARVVEGLMYEHGIITMVLDSGTIAYLNTVQGKRIGMVFKGRGSISYQPSNETERTNLERFIDMRVFTAEFEKAVMIGTDPSLLEQIDALPKAPVSAINAEEKVKGKTVPNMHALVDMYWASLGMGYPETAVDGTLAKTMLNGFEKNIFMCRFIGSAGVDGFAIYDPYEIEPYRLALVDYPNSMISGQTLVSQCPRLEGHGATTDDGVDDGDLVRTIQHTAEVKIDRALDIVANDRVDMAVIQDSLKWVNFILYPTLKVDSIKLKGGSVLTFVQFKDAADIWIELPSFFKKGEKFSLEIYYHGDVINRVYDYPILITSILWYPSHSTRHKTFFDVTFTYPESMTLAAVGKRNTFTDDGDFKTARWTTGREVSNYSFHIGFFKRKDLKTEAGEPNSVILYKTIDQADVVANDVQQSVHFFSKLFGKLPIDSLIATELPGFHGEAFPGLVHLSHMTFSVADDNNFFAEQFIAHEVAHQWWGVYVNFKSYRDQWLSEGFAMYSCLLYSQLAAKDAGKFFKLLENYRKEIVKFGKVDIGKNLAPPAINLGYRVGEGAREAGAYNTFVYYKGAWVLHMLRNMMLDMNTMKEDAFMTTMKTFYEKYGGKRASTEDFRQTIEDVTGVNLSWFFDQWVYGNKIPTYTYAWRKNKTPDGKWQVKLRIKQTGVPESFQMFIPVKVTFDDDKVARYRIAMKGAEATMDLPASDKEPDEFTFNDLSSVLCEMDEESFD